MFMSGPLLAGYTQTVNDWYDREIDAINEPNRPIPSGLITENQVIAQIWALLLSGVAVAAGLDWWAGHWFDGVSGVFIGPMQVCLIPFPIISPTVLFEVFSFHCFPFGYPLSPSQFVHRWVNRQPSSPTRKLPSVNCWLPPTAVD